ncbi:MAG: viscotoxin-A3 [Eggerthellaceae bacterium]|nr:viscotoxin-A3 [Eggerthellaceae bacterium]
MLPPIWGAANGIWVTVLFYPVWLFADNCFYQAFTEPTTLAVVLAVIVFVTLLAITVIFAIVSQPFAAHRAESMGVSREKYLARQRKWAIGCTIGGIVLLALATFYNLVIRPTVGA